MISISRRAGLFSTVWIAVTGFVIVSQMVAAIVVARYGHWIFTTLAERTILHGLFAAAGALIAIVAGLVMWLALWVVGRAADHLPRTWLLLGAALTTIIWVPAMFTRAPLDVFSNPLLLTVIALWFFILLAYARGVRSWLASDVAILQFAFLVLLLSGLWLNLVYIRQADSLESSLLNAIALIGTGALTATGLALGSGRNHHRESRPNSANGMRPVLKSVVLLVFMAVAAFAFTSLYEVTALADPSKGSTWDGAGGRDESPIHTEEEILFSLTTQNLILISIDTLRADHLGLLGYGRPTSPNVDEFFSDGVVFTQAFSQTPWTLPSHVSMLTGLYPSTHGTRVYPTVTRGYVDRICEDVVLVAETLSAAGLATAGFTGGAYLTTDYGFDRGCDDFGVAETMRMREVLDMALPWLRDNATKRFFLFLHGFDVHRYNPPPAHDVFSDEGYDGPLRRIRERRPIDLENLAVGDGFYSLDEEDLGFLIALYDSEIRYVDEQLLRLFTELRNLNLLENTSVILTSDHGESFAEHGTTGHAFNLYGPALHVPLLIRSAGANRRTVTSRVQTVDIAPTILDLLGLPASERSAMQGDSLVPTLAGSAIHERPIICEADALDTQAAVMSGQFKYINYGILSHDPFDPRFLLLTLKGLLSPYAKSEELFDLEGDPEELFDVSMSDPKRTDEFRSDLIRRIRVFRQSAVSNRPDGQSPMSPRLEEQLRSLGYIE